MKKVKDDWSHATQAEPNVSARINALDDIILEIMRAYKKHGSPRWGRHEAWAIIQEELTEVQEAVFKDMDWTELYKELIQVAAMVIRYIETEPNLIAVAGKIHNPKEFGGSNE